MRVISIDTWLEKKIKEQEREIGRLNKSIADKQKTINKLQKEAEEQGV